MKDFEIGNLVRINDNSYRVGIVIKKQMKWNFLSYKIMLFDTNKLYWASKSMLSTLKRTEGEKNES